MNVQILMELINQDLVICGCVLMRNKTTSNDDVASETANQSDLPVLQHASFHPAGYLGPVHAKIEMSYEELIVDNPLWL